MSSTSDSSPDGHRTTNPATLAGDPFAYAGRRIEEARRGLRERRTEAELVEDLFAEEERRGYPMSYGERVAFAYGYFAPEYATEVRRLMVHALAEGEDL
jgi:hypothetical protein